MENIQFKTEFADKDIPVIKVMMSGYIDQANCDQLQNVFDNLFSSQHYNLVFDMSDLSYMSSAGWGIFVGEVKRFRDRGGDIKLSEMKPEVYEIFQMLEFYHILDDYYSSDEAVEIYRSGSFGRKESMDEIVDDTKRPEEGKSETVEKLPGIDQKVKPEDVGGSFKGNPYQIKSEPDKIVNMSRMPLPDKIRKIIAMYPLVSIKQLKKLLQHDDFGNVSIGLIRLYFLLRKLNLETKTKRYRYYRSC